MVLFCWPGHASKDCLRSASESPPWFHQAFFAVGGCQASLSNVLVPEANLPIQSPVLEKKDFDFW